MAGLCLPYPVLTPTVAHERILLLDVPSGSNAQCDLPVFSLYPVSHPCSLIRPPRTVIEPPSYQSGVSNASRSSEARNEVAHGRPTYRSQLPLYTHTKPVTSMASGMTTHDLSRVRGWTSSTIRTVRIKESLPMYCTRDHKQTPQIFQSQCVAPNVLLTISLRTSLRTC